MLLMLLVGWTILLPALVIAGLYLTSSVLTRRRARRSTDVLVWPEALVDDPSVDGPVAEPAGPVGQPAAAEPVNVVR